MEIGHEMWKQKNQHDFQYLNAQGPSLDRRINNTYFKDILLPKTWSWDIAGFKLETKMHFQIESLRLWSMVFNAE